jgi:CD109 antigen
MEEAVPERFLGASAPKKPIEIRKTFPETWLFDNLEFSGELKKVLTKKVPDTITSWIITGFSINSVTGLGITKNPSKFSVFQPFFVSTNLPYSIKQGEVVSIPVTVFNYLESDQDANVTLFNKDGEFEFVDADSDGDSKKDERTKTISIKSNEGANVSFMIKALKVGNITIKIVAESAVAGDGVEKQLRVEPLGVTQFNNEAVFIDLRSTSEFSTVFDINIPENVVPDSTHIEIGAIGDILGPSLNNLDKLM